LGFVLTAATLVYKSETKLDALPEVFKALVAAANAALASGPPARKYGRRTLFARSEKYPINAIRKIYGATAIQANAWSR
jgi:hypothetical protein